MILEVVAIKIGFQYFKVKIATNKLKRERMERRFVYSRSKEIVLDLSHAN